jgi:hypothetical protein
VKVLGGSTAVARALGVHRNAVIAWQQKGKVSGRYALTFLDLCKKYDVPISITQVR